MSEDTPPDTLADVIEHTRTTWRKGEMSNYEAAAAFWAIAHYTTDPERLGTAEQDAPGVGVRRRLRDRLEYINDHIELVEANKWKSGLSSRERQMILYAERDEADFLTAWIGDM